MKNRLFIVFFSLFIAGGISAENLRNASTFGNFLKISPTARPSGLGEAFTAIANDINSIYWNPSGLSLMEKNTVEIGLTHTQWFVDTSYDCIGLAYSFGKTGAVALGVSYINYGAINERDDNGNETGSSFYPYDLLITSSYARNLYENVLSGISIKFFRENIYNTSYNAVLFDVGLLQIIELGKLSDLSLGVSLQNLGPKVSGYNLPLNLKIGVALKIFQVSFFFADENVWELAKYNKKKLRIKPEDTFILAVDGIIPMDNQPNLNIGFEYWVYDIIALRMGYKYKSGGNDLGPVSGLAVGAGINVFGPVLDYAYSIFDDLGSTHRLSLTFKL